MWPFSCPKYSGDRVDNKVIVITGANSGIGRETAFELVYRGGTVIMANRSVKNSEEAVQSIRDELQAILIEIGFPSGTKFGTIEYVELDLASLESVRRCGCLLLEKYGGVDILINNAGIMACDRGVTKDGLEMQMGTNHIGHFLLTCILLPSMVTGKGRIVNLSSIAHRGGKINFEDFNSEKSYSPSFNYANSKLANILFTRELARRLKERHITEVTTYAVHPGIVATRLSRHLSNSIISGATFFWDYIMRPFIKTPEQGAQTTLHCATNEDAASESGFYYSDCKKTMPARRALDKEAARMLWEKSVELTKMTWDPFDPQVDPRQYIVLK